jgi:hypothetical protein
MRIMALEEVQLPYLQDEVKTKKDCLTILVATVSLDRQKILLR